MKSVNKEEQLLSKLQKAMFLGFYFLRLRVDSFKVEVFKINFLNKVNLLKVRIHKLMYQ